MITWSSTFGCGSFGILTFTQPRDGHPCRTTFTGNRTRVERELVHPRVVPPGDRRDRTQRVADAPYVRRLRIRRTDHRRVELVQPGLGVSSLATILAGLTHLGSLP
jgi:hypothetical protein